MEEDYKPTVQSQRRVKLKIHEVIKKEVLKLLDAEMIYPISDNPWVSSVHCVPKRGGITIVANEDNELIPTRLVTREGIVLGHKISKSGIEIDRAKVDVIAKLPHPTTVKGVRGHAGFYRRFIQDFSKIARPMTYLLEKETPFVFSKDCIDAFETLKKKLTEAPILVVPDWNLPFELMCVASDFAIGAVLGQRKMKHFQPIHYTSKTMTEPQIHYTTTEKEMLAVVYAFEKFWPNLVLSKSIVYTDHSDLKYLMNKQDAKPRLLRYCKVNGEIEGELRDEANVADPCKGAVSFDSAMFEKQGRSIDAQKKNSQPLQKLMAGLTCPGWIGVDKSQLAQDILHSTRWSWSVFGAEHLGALESIDPSKQIAIIEHYLYILGHLESIDPSICISWKLSSSALEMLVPGHAVGNVMGRGRANVDNIRKISEASVEISDNKSSCGDRVAVISGKPEQKRTAESLIQTFIMAT
ncbi:reverse transcriptase domain-containing protein [Tanacetum coccineum]